jgi:hypothetical protein
VKRAIIAVTTLVLAVAVLAITMSAYERYDDWVSERDSVL